MSNEDKEKTPEELRRELQEKVRRFTNDSSQENQSSDDNDDNKSSSEDSQQSSSKESKGFNFNYNKQSNSGKSSSNNNFQEGSFLDKVKKALAAEMEKQARAKGSSGGNDGGDGFKVKGLLSIAGVALLGLFLFNSFYTVNESSRGIVTRLGAYHTTTTPGLNFKIPLIDKVQVVNVQQVSDIRLDGTMLTRDENVVIATLTVQYRIVDPVSYLFKVDEPIKTLREATESSLRYVVGHMDMDEILTTGRSVVREDTRQEIIKLINNYETGIEIVDVNFQTARPPESVKEAFDDAIKAQEDEQRYIREAEAYMRSREPIARGQAQQIIASAQGYARQVVAKAEGDKAFFDKLLPQFLAQPQIFKQRYYLEQMAQLYANTPKVILEEGVNLNFLSLDKLLANGTPNNSNLTLPSNTKGAIDYTPSNTDSAPVQSPVKPSVPATDSSNSSSNSQTPSRFSGNRVGGGN